MPSLPSALALDTAIGPVIAAGEHVSNYSAIQAAVNALISALSAGSAGQLLSGNGPTLTWAVGPGQELAYTEQQANVNVTATTEATANTIVDTGSLSYSGAPVMVECYVPQVQLPTVLNSFCSFALWDGATNLGVLGGVLTPAAQVSDFALLLGKRKLTPSAGAHQYILKAHRDGGAGTVTVNAGNGGAGLFLPAFVRVTAA